MADQGASVERQRGKGLLRALYHRLGPTYPRVAFVLSALPFYPVFLGAAALVAMYADMSTSDFVRLSIAVVVVQTVYNVAYTYLALRGVRPVVGWLEGRRSPEQTMAAWEAAAELPLEYLRRIAGTGLAVPGVVAWCAYATWELELPASAFFALFAGSIAALANAIALGFLLTERVVRPLLEDIGRYLPGDAALGAPNVPLRWRLLGTIPVINVGTAVVATALSSEGDVGLGDLGVDVLIAVAVALTASLWLTALLAGSIHAPLERLREATERLGRGDLAVRVPVASTDETGRLSESFNRMATGLQERERLRDAFGTFVDPSLAERVLEEGTDLKGEEVEVSILFLDVRGFTELAERSNAREVVAKLNDLYEQVVPVVTAQGGHANKFIGDGMLAVFGAPERQPDHADRAVQAALEIARLVRERYRGELRVGVGVNSGRVLVGTVGGGGRLDFTVIGDPVNTAARVESATRQTGDDVLISEATRQLLSASFEEFESRPPIPLKGKSEPVPLYAPRSLEPAEPIEGPTGPWPAVRRA